MEEMIGGLLETIEIGELQTFKNMSVVPLKVAGRSGLEYLTLRQGFEQGVLTVQEISEAGAVPELSVVNKGILHILLLDGEEIRGAKQNRVLNTSVLVAPGAKTVIPVSCTEQGRWNYTSKVFDDSGVLMARSIRTSKQASVTRNVRQSKRFASDQGEVWEQVACLHQDLGTSSRTGAMRDAYELKKADLEDYTQAFSNLQVQNGIAVFLGGEIVGIDFLSHAPAMDNLLPKLISSYAMDAIRIHEGGKRGKPNSNDVKKFLTTIDRCTLESYHSQGVGDDARLESDQIQGAALIALKTVIHLAAFAKSEKSAQRGSMSSFSRRRNFRNPHH